MDVLRQLWNLQQHVLDLLSECLRFFPAGYSILPYEVISINDRRFKIIRQLGEGGYAIVYLVRELPTPQTPLVHSGLYAVKKIHAASGERLTEARREVEALHGVAGHPNVLRLIDSAIVPSSTDSSLAYAVYLLFPAYTNGTLQDELQRLATAQRSLATFDVLDIFIQVCRGVAHMHARGIAHRDLKPHNVLLVPPGGAASGATSTSLLEEEEEQGGQQGGGGEAVELGELRRGRWEAVVMDLGSARPLMVEVGNRGEALALQEDAESHCTGTYRAPELFDVASGSCIDHGRCDVWSLGCLLYATMYGASPFQEDLDRGASLALAVLNCRLRWPQEGGRRYPGELHDLVGSCLAADPERRPDAAAVLHRAQQLQARRLPDPGNAAARPAGC